MKFIDRPNISPDPNYPLILGRELFQFSGGNTVGGEAQGLHKLDPVQDPRKAFSSHFILEVEDTLFDPSYGVPSEGGVDRLMKYEDKYIEYHGEKLNVLIGGNPQAITVFKPNEIGTLEMGREVVYDE